MSVPDRHHEHDDQPTATAAGPREKPGWPVPGWQWDSLAVVLLGGQAVVLVLTTWTLATSASHGWPLPIILALGLLARLVPDTLKLAAWAAAATTWTPPVHQRLHLAVTAAALALADLVAVAT